MIIISSPSGAGKSSILKQVVKNDDSIKMSISATTRKPRDGEENGVHYHFLDKDTFMSRVNNNEFLEYAEVFGNMYGTLKSEIESKFKNNNNVIMDIDWQGAQNITKKMEPERLLKIFILPPSLKELEKRLINRGLDSSDVIKRRISNARSEIQHFKEYDYIVVNEDFETALKEIESLIIAKKFQNIINSEIENFVQKI